MNEEIAGWLRLVRRDMASSRGLLAIDQPENAAFLAQQAIEKLFKAVLVDLGVTPPRTHDLERLDALLPVDQARVLSRVMLDKATAWAVIVRYDLQESPPPDPSEVADVLAQTEAYLTRRGW